MIAALLPILAPIIGQVVKSKFPDPAEAAQAQSEVTMALLAQSQQIEAAASQIILAEAKSEHFLAATWRPVLMLVFGGLIVARWFGWAAPELSEAEYLKLWDIVEFGLGGYVVGRSVEKITPDLAKALRKG
ncbi:MAG: 3TM-type holin [Limnobacter sp.]|uniref:3TM-type holin n=1 Tax=Limnobacter sp. TaxID=2003368 RepID=UPI00391A7CBD